MPKLLIPAAGLSTRFGLDRPKWLLRHPNGLPMIAAGLVNLREMFDSILVVALAEHLDGVDIPYLENLLCEAVAAPVEILQLDKRTSSMVETIVEGLTHINQEISFVVKDADNLVGVHQNSIEEGKNFVATADLRVFGGVEAANKSFVVSSDNGSIVQIVEKSIVSNTINTGLVGFASSSDFLAASMALRGTGETFVSTVITELIQRGEVFLVNEATAYEDWGTLRDWLSFKEKFASYFVAVEGIVFRSIDPFSNSSDLREFNPISANVSRLLELQRSGASLIFLSSRPERDFEEISKALSSLGFSGNKLVLSLPEAKRNLVNIFDPANPFPSANAINISCDSDSLPDFI